MLQTENIFSGLMEKGSLLLQITTEIKFSIGIIFQPVGYINYVSTYKDWLPIHE